MTKALLKVHHLLEICPGFRAPQIRQSLMKRMAQAYINEISVENAAELIAKEMSIMLKVGYDLT